VRKLAIATVVLMVLYFGVLPAAFADNLQDVSININGTVSPEGSISGTGVTSTGFDPSSTTIGGTITITVLGSACTSSCGENVDVWIFDPPSVPDYNEYGATSGAASTGENWQVDVPDYDSEEDPTCPGSGVCLDPNHPNTDILANTDADTLSNSNNVPGAVDNYLGTCSGADCNDIVSMALGFDFTNPGAGNEEVITIEVNSTGCTEGGICLETVQPVDPNNATSSVVYMDGSAVSEAISPVGAVPEPSSLLMLGSALMGMLVFRKKFSAN